MKQSHQELLSLLDFVERSDMDFIEIQFGDTRIIADRSGRTVAGSGTAGQPVAAQTPVPPAVEPAAAPRPADGETAPSGSGVSSDPLDNQAAAGDADLVTVPAPVVGAFYKSPEPGAPPFVELGDHVEEGATLGLIEVMKVFNSVSAPVSGEVVELLVDNEGFVEHGQALMRIRPESSQ